MTNSSIISGKVFHEEVQEQSNIPAFFAIRSRFSPVSDDYGDCDFSAGASAGTSVVRETRIAGRDHEVFVPAHWHEYVELLYVLDGDFTVIVNADTYYLKRGDLMMINSGELHMTRRSRLHTFYILIQVSDTILRQSFAHPELLHFEPCIRAADMCAAPGLEQTIASMKSIFEEKADGYQLIFTARLYELLHILYVNGFCRINESADEASVRDMKRIMDVMKWTKENFRDPLSMADAAAHTGISREYFCRLFKKYTGQTYLEYLSAVRAMSLYSELKSSDLNLTLLMEQNGIANYKTFMRTFRNLYGATPRQVRRGAE